MHTEYDLFLYLFHNIFLFCLFKRGKSNIRFYFFWNRIILLSKAFHYIQIRISRKLCMSKKSYIASIPLKIKKTYWTYIIIYFVHLNHVDHWSKLIIWLIKILLDHFPISFLIQDIVIKKVPLFIIRTKIFKIKNSLFFFFVITHFFYSQTLLLFY
mgnify:CR=1 FL=1